MNQNIRNSVMKSQTETRSHEYVKYIGTVGKQNQITMHLSIVFSFKNENLIKVRDESENGE